MSREEPQSGRKTTSDREKIKRAIEEQVAVEPYDCRWPKMFEEEKEHLLSCLPEELIGRIEHFGSTAVPGLAAKPIVDILVEVTDLAETRRRIVPILEAQGYEYFWRPSFGDDTPPFYAWFIKRDASGKRTHHIHMVERHFEHWDRLLFRDYLRDHQEVAKEYEALKLRLSKVHRDNRATYTKAKTDFIVRVTEMAKNDSIKNLLIIPGVGKSLAVDLWDLGVRDVADLRGRDPRKMYEELCLLRGQHIDRCVLYVFRCAVYFATEKQPDPHLLKWWNWKDVSD